MDIEALSMVMHQSSLFQQVDISLTKKVLDSANESSQNLINAMALSVNPNLGSNLDLRA
jgi:hypothetical protein